MNLFWEQGYEATAMRELVERMGIGRQSLYDTFGDKHTLYLESLQHYFQTRLSAFVSVLSRPGSASKNLHDLFDAWITMARDTNFCGCFVGNTLSELGATDPEVRQVVGSYFMKIEKALADTVERGQQQGEFRADIDPLNAARMIVSMSQGLALMSKTRVDVKYARGVMQAAMASMQIAPQPN